MRGLNSGCALFTMPFTRSKVGSLLKLLQADKGKPARDFFFLPVQSWVVTYYHRHREEKTLNILSKYQASCSPHTVSPGVHLDRRFTYIEGSHT